MTNSQQNTNKMHGVVLGFFDDNPGILTNRKALSDLTGEAKGLLLEIKELDKVIEEARNTGVAGGKLDARTELQRSAFIVEKGILVYAQMKKDATLAGLMKYLKSDLSDMSDSELETAAGVVLKQAKALLPELKDVDVTLDDVTELETLLTSFSAQIKAPRTQIVNRSEKIGLLKKKMDRMKELFVMIDGWSLVVSSLARSFS